MISPVPKSLQELKRPTFRLVSNFSATSSGGLKLLKALPLPHSPARGVTPGATVKLRVRVSCTRLHARASYQNTRRLT
jgi:hypothetical protein